MRELRNPHSKLEAYYQSIKAHTYSDIEQMKDESEELLRYSYQLNDTYGQAFAFIHLTIYYIAVQKLDSARFNIAKAKALSLRYGYSDFILNCYRYEGTIYQMSGNKIKAIHLYGKALNLAEKKAKDTVIGILYNNIAIILMNYKDFSLAKDYFEQATNKFMQQPRQETYLVQAYINLIQVCCDLQDVDSAVQYHTKAITLHEENHNILLSLKASQIRLYAQLQKPCDVNVAYQEFQEMIENYQIAECLLIPELLLILESLLIAGLRNECRSLLMKLGVLLDDTNIEQELQYLKLHVQYLDTYQETYNAIYERYYQVIMKSENQEYSSLAESLRGHIQLSEISQKQSALEKENETLQIQAHLDEMTSLYNRRYYDKLLLKINADPQVKTIGCIMLDIDHFKEYNDTYGHLQGDQVIILVAKTLHKHAVKELYVGRYGGDEFYCLCAGMDTEQIEAYLNAVFADLQNQRIEHCKNVGQIVTISAGYYHAQKTDSIIKNLLDYADQALYTAKKRGRNGFASNTDTQ